MASLKGTIAKRISGNRLLLLISRGLVLLFVALRTNISLHLVEELTRKELLTLLKYMTSRKILGKRFLHPFVIRLNGSQGI